MSEFETVKKKIMQLSRNELSKFRKWFAEYDAKIWDEQIEADAAAGRLDMLAEEAMEEYRAGEAKEI